MRPDLSFICVSDRPDCLRALIACLRVQSNPRWELHVLDQTPRASCLAPVEEVEKLGERRIEWTHVPYVGDVGQTAKFEYTKYARGEYVCYPCDDRYYAPCFVQVMMFYGRSKKWDLVYCNMIADHSQYVTVSVAPIEGRVDIGGFIVKPHLVLQDGWERRDGRGDGALVERIAKNCSHGLTDNYVMYVKN